MTQDYFEYNASRNDDFINICPLLLWVVNAVAVACCFLNLIRKMFLYRLAKYRDNHDLNRVFVEYFFRDIPVESILILLNPMPFFIQQRNFSFLAMELNGATLRYVDNDMLQLASVFKLFLFLRAILTKTAYCSDRAFRVCDIFTVQMDYRFVIKCVMKKNPFTLSFAWLVIGVLYFGHAIRITEKPLKQATDVMDFTPFFSCIWAAFITMSTVGYGDMYPRTNKGRVVMIFCCLYGVTCISLIIVSVTQVIQMSQAEVRSHVLVKRIVLKNKVKKEACKLIAHAWRSRQQKQGKSDAHSEIEAKRKMRKEFMEACEEYKELNNEMPIEDRVRRSFEDLLGDLKKLKSDAMEVCRLVDIDPVKLMRDDSHRLTRGKSIYS